MDEKQITKIAFFVAIIGIIIIFLLSTEIQPKTISIPNITQDMMGEVVRVCGEITDNSTAEGNLFFKLRDENNNEIDVVFFNKAPITTKNVCIEGEISLYKQKLEIIGKKYEVFD